MTDHAITDHAINDSTNSPQTIPPATALATLPVNLSPASPETSTVDNIWEDESQDQATEKLLSELPAMKRQHMNDGYREGLSTSKAKVMQAGFDEGYPIGVQIAMRVGPILGVLEAYLACKSIYSISGMREKVRATYKDALHELDIGNILQTTDETVLAALKSIPASSQETLEYWEGQVSAVYEVRKLSMAMYDQDNPHALREVVEAAKQKDPARFNPDRTDKAPLGPGAKEEWMEENQYRYKGRKPNW